MSSVHGLLSLQSTSHPAWFRVTLHPTLGSQTSSVQGSPSSQTSGTSPTQTPARQVSAVVQAFPSSQADSSGNPAQETDAQASHAAATAMVTDGGASSKHADCNPV
jgi:hypothetical protein